MSPVNFGQPSAGTQVRCGTHRVPLVRAPREVLAERIATERGAEDALRMFPDLVPPSLPRTPTARKGYCPRCTAEVAAAALAFLQGET